METPGGLTNDASLAEVLEQNVRVVTASIAGRSDAVPPMTALLSARMAADAVEEATSVLVARARDAGRTWQEVGELLAITRQAAQQRFTERAPDARDAVIAARAREIIDQIQSEAWAQVTADWDEVMRVKLTVAQLAETWQQIVRSAGALRAVGQATITRKGPFRVVDVPLVFADGPMKARVAFNTKDEISGLFVLLPDAP